MSKNLIIKPNFAKIDQNLVKLVSRPIRDEMHTAREAALNDGVTSYILDNIGNIYKYTPTDKKSPFYPEANHGYNVTRYFAPTKENIDLGRLCYIW